MNSDVKYLVMDVDGTLTDGKIYMSDKGELFKAFDIKDGGGIHDILPKYSITPVIITGRESNIVKKRCAELNISNVYQGCRNKLETLLNICCGELSTVAYIGDDILDIECMKAVNAAGGIVGCPNDAIEDVKKLSDYICEKEAGKGAVREFIEMLVARME